MSSLPKTLKYYDEPVTFRNDINAYFIKNELSTETFYFDILKDLCDADVDCDRIVILLLLEQNAQLLLPTIEAVEQTIGSLIQLYNTCKTKDIKKNVVKKVWQFKGQILVTITSILLSRQDKTESLQLFYEDLLTQLKELLLVEATGGSIYFIKSIACQCMEELESFIPGFLSSEIDIIQKHSSSKKSPVTPQFLSLYFLVLKNKHDWDWRTSLIKDEDKEGDDQKVLFLINNLYLLSPPHLHSVLTNVEALLGRCSSEMLWKLKPRIGALCSTYDLPFIQLLLNFQNNFGSMVMNKETEYYFTKQLLELCCLPCVPKSHQLLCMEWINQHLPLNKEKYNHWLVYETFTPNPFEGPDTFEKKVKVMVNLPPGFKEDRQSSILLQCLEAIEKCIHKNNNIRPLGSLFRSLFISFKRWHNSEMAEPFIKLILNMLLSLLPCFEHFNNFHNQINVLFPNCVALNILKRQLISHTCTFQPDKAIHCWEYYYRLLINFLNQPQSSDDIKNLLEFWKTLLKRENTLLESNIGLTMIEMLTKIMEFQDFVSYREDLVSLFLAIQNVFSEDIRAKDSKDQEIVLVAKFQMLTLKSLSDIQIKASFAKCANIVKQSKESGDKLPPMINLINCIFNLERETNAADDKLDSDLCFKPLTTKSCFKGYKQYLASLERYSSLPLNYVLSLKPVVKDAFRSVFAILCRVQTSPACEKIEDILFPILMKNVTNEQRFKIELVPELCSCISIHIRAEFSAKDNKYYFTDLPLQDIMFRDLFVSLPVCQSYKKVVFDSLWDKLEFMISRCISLSQKQTRQLIKEHWEEFVIPDTDTDVGILLVGKHHLLIKFRPAESGGTKLTLKVEEDLVPALFEEYLKTLLPQKKKRKF